MAAYQCSEQTKCYWVVRLLLEGGKELLVKFLQQYIGTSTLDEYLAVPANKYKVLRLRQRRPPIIQQKQFDILYPPGGGDTDTRKWDITLTACILKELIYPVTAQQKEAITNIRELRNDLYGHIGKFLLGENEFDHFWKMIQQILQDGANNLLNNPGIFNLQDLVIKIQKEEVTNVDILKEIFQSWKESDNEVLAVVQEHHEKVETHFAAQNAELYEIKKTVHKIERNQKNQNSGE